MSAVSLPLEVLADELAGIARDVEADVRKQVEVIVARGAQQLAEIESRFLERRFALREFEDEVLARIEARNASLRDGIDGKDGRDGIDGVPGRDGLNGKDGSIGLDGKDGIDGAPGRDGIDGAPGRDGVDGKDGLPGLDGAPGNDGAPGRDGTDGSPGSDGAPGRDGLDGRNGLDGKDGESGIRGPEGPPGKLPVVKTYARGVHYEGEVVTCGGSLWQASKDTGEAPGHEDWLILAAAGRDAKEIEHCGAYDSQRDYDRNNIVAMDGGSFISLRDNPGDCPGDGWRLLVARGKTGKPGLQGDKGDRGLPGPPGNDGVGILDVSVQGFALIISKTNGETIARDLRPMFEDYHAQARS